MLLSFVGCCRLGHALVARNARSSAHRMILNRMVSLKGNCMALTAIQNILFDTGAAVCTIDNFSSVWSNSGGSSIPDTKEGKVVYTLGVNIAKQVGSELKVTLNYLQSLNAF